MLILAIGWQTSLIHLFCGGPMRLLKTFIVHIYFDTNQPERLCGNVRPLEDQECHPFKSQTELVAVLHQLIGKLLGKQITPLGLDIKSDQ